MLTVRPPVLLIYPPPSDPTQPYTSLPALAARLVSLGIPVVQRDVAIETLLDICDPEQLRRRWRAALARNVEDIAPASRIPFRRRMAGLSICTAYVMDHISEALRVLRDQEGFYDLDRYRWASRMVALACDIASAAHHPTVLAPNTYHPVVELSLRGLLEGTRRRADNLYAPLYEARWVRELLAVEPALIGMSITYHHQLVPGLTLARMLKEAAPEIPLVIGGAVVVRMERQLSARRDWFTFADYFCVGEGETALEVLSRSRARPGWESAPNVISREARKWSPDTRFLEPAAALLTPVFDPATLPLYLSPEPVLPVQTSRGCYYGRCAFCDVSRQSRRLFRPLSTGQVRDHVLELRRRHGARRFLFCDDAMPPSRLSNVADLVGREAPEVTWQAEARFDQGITHKLIARLRAGGCRQLIFGLESACQRVLDLMNKRNTEETDRRILRACSDVGIAVNLQTFVGFPGERREEAEQTISFLIENERAVASFGFGLFTLYEHTAVFDDPARFGVQDLASSIADGLLGGFEFSTTGGMSRYEARVVHESGLERLLPVFQIRSEILGGASGAHSLLQFSHFDYRTLYEMWKAHEQRSGALSPCDGLPVCSAATAKFEDGPPSPECAAFAFVPATCSKLELGEFEHEILVRCDGTRTGWEIARDFGSGGDGASLQAEARALAILHEFFRTGVVADADPRPRG